MPIVLGFLTLLINSVSPQTIDSAEDLVTINASYSGSTTAQQYLQVVFYKEGQSQVRYFGLTQNQDSAWYQYKSSPVLADLTSYFYRFTPINASWSGQLMARVDTTSEWYKGPGDYLLKLFRHVTAAGIESDNKIPVKINIPLEMTAVTTSTSDFSETTTPSLEWSLPSNASIGASFKINLSLKNFSGNTEYYLKARGGSDEDHLTKMQTKSGNSYLSDNETWASFPLVKTDGSGNWSGELWAQFPEDREPGTYKVRVKVRKKETETSYETDLKEIKVEKKIEKKIVAVAPVVKVINKEATPAAAIVLGTVSAQPVKSERKTDYFNVVLLITGLAITSVSVIMGSKWLDRTSPGGT